MTKNELVNFIHELILKYYDKKGRVETGKKLISNLRIDFENTMSGKANRKYMIIPEFVLEDEDDAKTYAIHELSHVISGGGYGDDNIKHRSGFRKVENYLLHMSGYNIIRNNDGYAKEYKLGDMRIMQKDIAFGERGLAPYKIVRK